MSKNNSIVDQVLDEIEALYQAKKEGRFSPVLTQIAKDIGKPYERVYEWVVSRIHPPSLESHLNLQAWISKQKGKLTPAIKKAFNLQLKEVHERRGH